MPSLFQVPEVSRAMQGGAESVWITVSHHGHSQVHSLLPGAWVLALGLPDRSPVTSLPLLPSWESEAVHPGKVGTLFFPRWAVLRPKPQVPTAPAHACPPGSLFSLEVFVHSVTHSSLSLSILVTPTPLFSEGVSDVAEGGVGPHAGRHLP